jgi:hypothetical protein
MLSLSVWNTRLLFHLGAQVTAALNQQAGNEGVFLTGDGWSLGQFTPDASSSFERMTERMAAEVGR